VQISTDASTVRDICERTLRQNWRQGVHQGVEFGYTCPSPTHYPWQWYWDSCFTAIAWRRFDRERSQRELSSLLAAQREDGFIGHTIFWNTPLNGARRFTYNVTSPSASMTSTIQPPVLAWAWRIAVGDPREVPGIVSQHQWVVQHRDLDGDGLIWIIQPDESGLDASPQYDAVYRWRADGLPGFALLVRRNRRLDFDPRRIEAAGGNARPKGAGRPRAGRWSWSPALPGSTILRWSAARPTAAYSWVKIPSTWKGRSTPGSTALRVSG